jgi:rhodanese-related sulfurtransferase
MSEKPASTIGFERRYNRFAALREEHEFVRVLTGNLAPQPPNFQRIVELNRGPLVTQASALDAIAPSRVHDLLGGEAVLVDGRDTREFDAAHVPGSINVTMIRAAVGTRAAWVVDPDAEVVVTAGTDGEARRLGRLLEAVGFRRVRGHLAGGMPAWRDAGLEVSSTPAVAPSALAELLRSGEVELLDVREADEWEVGHVEGSLHVPYHDLREGLPDGVEVNGKPIAVACSTGNRSAIAASLLARAGVENVIHVTDGGIRDLAEEGIDLVA